MIAIREGQWRRAVVAACLPVLCASASAQDLQIDLASIAFNSDLNSSENVSLTFNVQPGALVNDLSYSVVLQAMPGSWLSEAMILIANSAGEGVSLAPAFGSDNPGTASFTGSLRLADEGLSFGVLPDGKLTLTFYDAFDNLPGMADALASSGTLTVVGVSAIPEPQAYMLLPLGLAGLAAWRQRQKARATEL